MTYRIVSFDGGGVRGVLSAAIANKVASNYPQFLCHTDVYAGTSTGGIIALGLASGKTLVEIVDMYIQSSKHIFSFGLPFGVVRPRYSNSSFRKVMEDHFGSMTVRDLISKIVIPAFDLDDESHPMRMWKTKVFSNFCGLDNDISLVDIALATSAAPTYFPTYKGYIDGGIVANNPTLCAVAQMFDSRNDDVHVEGLQDILVLSFATGRFPRYIEGDSLSWGALQWGTKLIDIPIEGGVSIVDYQCHQLLRDNYHRIVPIFTKAIYSLDAYDRVLELVELGDKWDTQPTLDWLHKVRW